MKPSSPKIKINYHSNASSLYVIIYLNLSREVPGGMLLVGPFPFTVRSNALSPDRNEIC